MAVPARQPSRDDEPADGDPDGRLDRLFAALADPTRRDMVARLADGDATVSELAAPYGVSMQAVSKHVKVLTDAGLVSRSKDAQRRPCHLEADVLDLTTAWIERYRRRAQARYERLDAVLDELRGDDPAADTSSDPAADTSSDPTTPEPTRGDHR